MQHKFIEQYKIIEGFETIEHGSGSASKFVEKEINNWLNQGWKLYGDLKVVALKSDKGNEIRYTQVLIYER